MQQPPLLPFMQPEQTSIDIAIDEQPFTLSSAFLVEDRMQKAVNTKQRHVTQ